MKKSWKTTLFGAVTAVGLGLSQDKSLPEWLQGIGQILTIAGPVLLGLYARDKNVSSEEQRGEPVVTIRQ